MGDMQKGVWRAEENFPHDRSGHFIRPDAPFRNWVTADGAPGGPTGTGRFKAGAGALSSPSFRSPARGRTAR